MSTRPTLAELVPGYAEVGISKRACVRYVVDSRMRSVIARGKGSKAARRASRIVPTKTSKPSIPCPAS